MNWIWRWLSEIEFMNLKYDNMFAYISFGNENNKQQEFNLFIFLFDRWFELGGQTHQCNYVDTISQRGTGNKVHSITHRNFMMHLLHRCASRTFGQNENSCKRNSMKINWMTLSQLIYTMHLCDETILEYNITSFDSTV